MPAKAKICQCGCEQPLTGRQMKYASPECSKKANRAAWIGKVYDLTLEEYQKIFDYQDGKCAICKRPPKPGKSLAVDHHHEAGQQGKVRGLLDYVCNLKIMGARSDKIILAMAEYVTNPPAVAALGREVVAPGRPKKARKRRARKPRAPRAKKTA